MNNLTATLVTNGDLVLGSSEAARKLAADFNKEALRPSSMAPYTASVLRRGSEWACVTVPNYTLHLLKAEGWVIVR